MSSTPDAVTGSGWSPWQAVGGASAGPGLGAVGAAVD